MCLLPGLRWAVPVVVALVAGVCEGSGAMKVVSCVGDSITYGDGDLDGYLSYPTQLEGMLGPYAWTVHNFGKSGRTAMTTKDAYVYQSIYEAALASAADIYVIQLGTNDAKLQFWAGWPKGASLARVTLGGVKEARSPRESDERTPRRPRRYQERRARRDDLKGSCLSPR